MTDMAKLNANMTQQWTRTIIKKIEDGRLQRQLIGVGDHGSREKGVWLYKLQAHEGELNQMGGDLESRTEVLDKKKKKTLGASKIKTDGKMQDGRIMRWCHEETSNSNVLEGTCGRALEGGITRQQLKWDEGEGCGHSLLAGRPSIFMTRLQSSHQSTCQEG